MAKILVTGATGFIGKHVTLLFSSLGHTVFGISSQNGDIADTLMWQSLPQADIVVHLASRTYVPDSWNDPLGFINTNLSGTICCLEYCRKYQAKLIYLSSYLYGNPIRLPINETDPLFVNNPYGLSKKMAEESCTFYSDNFGLSVIILRPFNVYGPDQSRKFIIPMIIEQVIMGRTISVKDLTPKRDYIYVEDLVNAIYKAVSLEGSHIFNIGSGISYSVNTLIEIIQREAGTNLPVISSNEKRLGEILDTKADISKAIRILGWSPQWTLESGINKIISRIRSV